jgi:hypothetical protein
LGQVVLQQGSIHRSFRTTPATQQQPAPTREQRLQSRPTCAEAVVVVAAYPSWLSLLSLGERKGSQFSPNAKYGRSACARCRVSLRPAGPGPSGEKALDALQHDLVLVGVL